MSIHLEQNLIQLCIEGNTAAQMQLYCKYAKTMFNTSLRIVKNKELAEDIMQNGFIVAFQKLKNFRAEASFKTWLSRIIINKSIDYIKKNKKVQFLDFELQDEIEELDSDNEEVYTVETVLEQLHFLPEKFRLVIELYYLDEFSHEEIANELQISYENSRILLHRAKMKLKQMLMNQIENV